MDFVAHTQEELVKLNIKDNESYDIEYLNRDYFNGEENCERCNAKAIKDEDGFIFIVTDPYGMDKYVKDVRIIS